MAFSFTPARGFRGYGPNGKTLLVIEGDLVLDAAGGGANPNEILATLFGLTQVIGISTFTKNDNTKAWLGQPAYDGASILGYGGAANAPQAIPAGTYKACVRGY